MTTADNDSISWGPLEESTETADGKIRMQFCRTNVFTRWPCDVCGGQTEKVEVLCEGKMASGADIRVCEFCLEAGNINERLERHASLLEGDTRFVRGLIGRLLVPSYASWVAANELVEGDGYDDRKTEATALAEGTKPMTIFTAEFGTDNAVFDGPLLREKYAKILRDIATKVESGTVAATICDSNGNNVGHWTLGDFDDKPF